MAALSVAAQPASRDQAAASPSSPLRSVSSPDLVSEPVAGGLPGYAEGDRDPVPTPAASAGCRDPFGYRSFVAADLLGCFGDRPQV